MCAAGQLGWSGWSILTLTQNATNPAVIARSEAADHNTARFK
jgi:hypothetical protein